MPRLRRRDRALGHVAGLRAGAFAIGLFHEAGLSKPLPERDSRREKRGAGKLLGCVAGMAVAALGTWVRFALAGTPRIDTQAPAFVIGSAIAGAGLVVASACAVHAARDAGRLGWASLLVASVAMQVASVGALALTSSDVFANLAFGALQAGGSSPYRHSPAELVGSPLPALVPERWVHDPTRYGPLFHRFVSVATRAGNLAGSPLWVPFYVYKLLLMIAVLAALALMARHLSTASDGGRVTFALVGLSPLLAWEVTAQGHNEGLLFLALVGFAVAAKAEQTVWATLSLVAGVAIKYALAPLLGLYLVVQWRRSRLRALGLVSITVALLAAAFAPELHAVTFRALPMFGGEPWHAHSLIDLACLVFDAAGLHGASLRAYRVLSACSAGLCAGLLLRGAIVSRTPEQVARAWLWFLFGLYLTAPWFQPWYVLWALPLLVLEPDVRWRRFVALFASLSVIQWAAPVDPFTTVIVDGWAALRLWQFARPQREAVGVADPVRA